MVKTPKKDNIDFYDNSIFGGCAIMFNEITWVYKCILDWDKKLKWRIYKDGIVVSSWESIPRETQYLMLTNEKYLYLRKMHGIIPEIGALNSEYKKHLSNLEKDENGTIFGYKVLLSVGLLFISPYWGNRWNDNEMNSGDSRPENNNSCGVYGMKTRNNPELYLLKEWMANSKIVRFCASGRVIESEFGIRAEKAKIVEVLN